jgi:hypothetical protein
MPWWIIALRLTGLGWYIALCVVGGVIIGIWFDRTLGVTPTATLIGTVLGSTVAFWGLYRMIVPILYGSSSKKILSKRKDE